MENQFCGCYNHTMDNKNRIFIPARFRDALGESFMIFRSPDGCLFVYTEEGWGNVLSQVRGSTTAEQRKKQRILYSHVDNAVPDKQGRITLTAEMVEHSGLSKDITIIGADDRIEIWDKVKWDEYLDNDDISEIADGIEF